MIKLRNKGKRTILLGMILLVMMITACGRLTGDGPVDSESGDKTDTGFVVTGPDSYDSADTAVLVALDREEGSATFLNLELGKRYTLSIDGTTRLYNKFDEAISLNQIETGDVVDILFLKSKKHLTKMQLSIAAWKYEGVEKYEMDLVRGEVVIGSDVYKITSNTQYLSDDTIIDGTELCMTDILEFQGIDSRILSVKVEKGHGYLRLANGEYFVGGWIEIGQQIQRITEDMLMVVPEGSYLVNISNKGSGGTKSVVINRNAETTLDIGDIEILEPKYGLVLFSVDPPTAFVYIDGKKVDISAPVSLEYGIHQLIVRASGYKSITQYLRVGQESAGIDIVLEKKESEEDDSESDSTSGSTTESSPEPVTDYCKIYVDAPVGVEVYLDGNYVGIAPCSFKKIPGTRMITLKKSGYESKSYSVQLDDDNKDVTFSFAELELIPASPAPSASPEASTSPSPGASPGATGSPQPSATPGATASPQPSATPGATASPQPSPSPDATQTPQPDLPGGPVTSSETNNYGDY